MELLRKVSWACVLRYAALMLAGFALAFGLISWIDPGSFGNQAPAWVQAVGSILAILIAVAVPAVQHMMVEQAKEFERSNRARSLGLLLLPHIRAFGDRNNLIWSHEHPDDDVQDLEENSCIAGSRTMAAMEVPPELIAHIDKIHELGPAAHGLQRAIFNVGMAKELVTKEVVKNQNESAFTAGFPSDVIFDKKQFYDLMWSVLGGLSESQNKIEGLFRVESRPKSTE